MELDFIFFFSVAIFAFFITCLFDTIEKGNSFNTFIACIYSLIITVFSAICLKEPTAMDVYRNKTTLEITYKDGMPIDSTVVWKDR